MKLLPILSLIIFLGLASAAAAVPSAEAIQPRAGDSRWDTISYYFEDGQPIHSGTSTEKVVETKVIDGQTIYRIQLISDWRGFWERVFFTPLDPEDFSYFWEYYTDRGSYHFTEDYDHPAPPESLEDFDLSLPYPTEAGHQYEAEGLPYRVLAVDREVEVPAGTFRTVVYELTDLDPENPEYATRERYFMAKGVGLVRWEMDVRGEDGNWILDSRDDLFSHSPAPSDGN